MKSIVEHFSQEPWSLLPLAISSLSLLVSLGSLFLSRRHASRLFEVSHHANLTFDLVLETSRSVLGDGSFADVQNRFSVPLGGLPLVVARWTNQTKNPASNLRARFALRGVGGWVSWDEAVDAGTLIEPRESGSHLIGLRIADALVLSSSDAISIREHRGSLRDFAGADPMVAFEDAKLIDTVPEFQLVVEILWSAPIVESREFGQRFTISLRPEVFNGVLIERWSSTVTKAGALQTLVSGWMSKDINHELNAVV